VRAGTVCRVFGDERRTVWLVTGERCGEVRRVWSEMTVSDSGHVEGSALVHIAGVSSKAWSQ